MIAIKQALATGQSVIGSMVTELRTPAIALILAEAGLDYLLLDMEHGAHTLPEIADTLKLARLRGIAPIVRIPDLAYHLVANVLDAGAAGVMLPRVMRREQVERLVAFSNYPPVGERGGYAGLGRDLYRPQQLAGYAAAVNAETLVIIQIEHRDALDRLDEILSVPGLDAVLIGPFDLAISYGLATLDDPTLDAAIATIIDACQRHSVAPGIHVDSIDAARRWRERGVQLLSCRSDLSFLRAGAAEVVGGLRG